MNEALSEAGIIPAFFGIILALFHGGANCTNSAKFA
jgi:hypothetical protein